VKVDNIGNIRTGNFTDTSAQLKDGELNSLLKATLKIRTGKAWILYNVAMEVYCFSINVAKKETLYE
jgi:hypothetical protein